MWAITAYHASVHATLSEPPIERLRYGLEHVRAPDAVKKPEEYRIDFLPMLTRRLGRTGFQIFHIGYYDAKLDFYIARRHEWASGFEIRYDPRNFRYIWVKRPDGPGYLKVCYRHMTNPDLSEWELRRISKSAKAKKQVVNEALIMRAAIAQKKVILEASAKSRRARKDKERLRHRGPYIDAPSHKTPLPPPPDIDVTEIKPFDDLEVDW